jgi:hypothetical protein
MIKEIKNNEVVFAIVVRSETELSEGHNFITDSKENFQVNIINQKKGHIISNHQHTPLERNIFGTQEVLYVEKGMMKVKFFGWDRELIAEENLSPGDLVVLLRGGHGFEFLEDSKIFYVKQGPYVDKATEKEVF